jgi:hypothetical protein
MASVLAELILLDLTNAGTVAPWDPLIHDLALTSQGARGILWLSTRNLNDIALLNHECLMNICPFS